MKVCDIVQFYSPLSGGVKRYVRDKMRFLETRLDMEHVVIVPSLNDEIRREGRTTVYHIRSRRLPGSASYRMLLARRRIEDIVAAEQPQVIEVGDPYWCAWAATGIREKTGIPVVAFYHSDYPRALGRTVRRFASPAAASLLSRPIESYLVRLYNRMDATIVTTGRFRHTLHSMGVRRLVCVPLGTDPAVFRPHHPREDTLKGLGIRSGTMLLLYVGRLAREKNIRQLLRMMDLLSGDEEAVHLLVVGDGELRGLVRGRTLGWRDITWIPYCESAETLAALYSAADLLVHPGTCETFGLVSLEAQACGTRVLAVRGGGLDASLAKEEHPVMAADARPESLAEAVRQVRRLRENGAHSRRRREEMIRQHTWSGTYERLIALYKHVHAHRPVEAFARNPAREPEAVFDPAVLSG